MTMSQTHQRPFYHHPASGATSWTRPEAPVSPPTATGTAATEKKGEETKAKEAPASSKPPMGPRGTGRPLTETPRVTEQRDERRPPTGPRGPGNGPSTAGPGRERDDRRFRDERPRDDGPRDDRYRDVRQEPRRRSPSPRRDVAKRPRVDEGGRRSPGPANRTFPLLPLRTCIAIAAASIPDSPVSSGRCALVS